MKTFCFKFNYQYLNFKLNFKFYLAKKYYYKKFHSVFDY